jgi:hypothetical protein
MNLPREQSRMNRERLPAPANRHERQRLRGIDGARAPVFRDPKKPLAILTANLHRQPTDRDGIPLSTLTHDMHDRVPTLSR